MDKLPKNVEIKPFCDENRYAEKALLQNLSRRKNPEESRLLQELLDAAGPAGAALSAWRHAGTISPPSICLIAESLIEYLFNILFYLHLQLFSVFFGICAD